MTEAEIVAARALRDAWPQESWPDGVLLYQPATGYRYRTFKGAGLALELVSSAKLRDLVPDLTDPLTSLLLTQQVGGGG